MQSSTSPALLHVNLLTSFVIFQHDTCNKSGLIQVLATFFNTSEYMELEWFVLLELLIRLQKKECTEETVTVCMQLDNCTSDARFSFRVEVVQNVQCWRSPNSQAILQ